VAERWVYLHRAIDQRGQVIDVLASPKRDLSKCGPLAIEIGSGWSGRGTER
jgi:hypothetical protein